MSPARKTAVKASLAALAVVALASLVLGVLRGRGSYTVAADELSGWRLVAAPPDDPALVALQPPAPLAIDLFQQLFQRTGRTLVAAAHPSVALVLRGEYADSLQGVLSTEDILDTARDAGIETARFEPVCMGERRRAASGRSDESYFVRFDAPAFDNFRERLTPLFPEHAGAFPYEPKALSPILMIAASDRELVRSWSKDLHEQTDCMAALRIRN